MLVIASPFSIRSAAARPCKVNALGPVKEVDEYHHNEYNSNVYNLHLSGAKWTIKSPG